MNAKLAAPFASTFATLSQLLPATMPQVHFFVVKPLQKAKKRYILNILMNPLDIPNVPIGLVEFGINTNRGYSIKGSKVALSIYSWCNSRLALKFWLWWLLRVSLIASNGLCQFVWRRERKISPNQSKNKSLASRQLLRRRLCTKIIARNAWFLCNNVPWGSTAYKSNSVGREGVLLNWLTCWGCMQV